MKSKTVTFGLAALAICLVVTTQSHAQFKPVPKAKKPPIVVIAPAKANAGLPLLAPANPVPAVNVPFFQPPLPPAPDPFLEDLRLANPQLADEIYALQVDLARQRAQRAVHNAYQMTDFANGIMRMSQQQSDAWRIR
jgi:hypothetical protein